MAAKLFLMVQGFDYSSTMRLVINEIFNKRVVLKLFTDSKSLYDCAVGVNSTTDKRVLVALRLLSHSCERREIAEILWITTTENPVGALNKKDPSPTLVNLLNKTR